MTIIDRIKKQHNQERSNKKWYRSLFRPIEGCIINLEKARAYNLQYSEIDATYYGIEVDEDSDYTHVIIPIYNLAKREEGTQLLIVSIYNDLSKLVDKFEPNKVYKLFSEDKQLQYKVSTERKCIIFDDEEINELFKRIPESQSITFMEEE